MGRSCCFTASACVPTVLVFCMPSLPACLQVHEQPICDGPSLCALLCWLPPCHVHGLQAGCTVRTALLRSLPICNHFLACVNTQLTSFLLNVRHAACLTQWQLAPFTAALWLGLSTEHVAGLNET